MFRYAGFAAILGLTSYSPASAAPKSPVSVQWSSCPQNESTIVPYECGTLEVPLDYTGQDDGTLNLKMVRVNHTKEPFMGSILFNAGGPGLNTRSLVAGSGADFLEITGGHYDLIGHDPRGAGDTIPYICYNQTEFDYVQSRMPPAWIDATDTATGEVWVEKAIFAEACRKNQAKYGELVGTAFTARDMMQIVDALGQDGLLRFWGFSYGSALGATVAAMFPDRIDKLIIDAVVNMRQYYTGLDYDQVLRTDDSFHRFLEACIEGREQCALAEQGNSADELQTKIYDLLEQIREQPLALSSNLTDLVFYGAVKPMITTGLRTPTSTWPILAQMLNALFTKNATAYQEANVIFGGYVYSVSWPDLGVNDGSPGIRCSDSSFRTENLEDLYPVIEQFRNNSYLVGGLLAAAQPMACSRWPYEARERIQWTPGYETKNPILLIGNTWDPLTPVEAAFNTSADFPGSRVIHQNSGGHGSISQESLCTINAIRSYFTNGTLPENGLFCEPYEPLGGFAPPQESLRKRSLMSEDDIKMLDAVKQLQNRMHFLR